ncbi:hypothetical protein DFJ73DRAFT_947975 [Zopfochytrium polystomum]|nr:hypothetical protein DFJ73DRAFT_947975 [Zopfochytrium polystomum]
MPPHVEGTPSEAGPWATAAEVAAAEAGGNDAVAIIGMALRAPGAGSNVERFWRMLLDGRSARGPVPADRYNVDSFYHPDPDRPGAIQQRCAHFLEQDYRVFDAPFFSLTPKEAVGMDPTHRMLLETTYESFENAGIRIQDVIGTRTSCFVGTFTADFSFLQARDNEAPSMYSAIGMSASLASNRISWFYDLKGASVTVDTACSSSLTAFHLGCGTLRAGEADLSVVAGSNLMIAPDMTIGLGGREDPFGAGPLADGVGVVVLKRLKDAIRDRDPIRAVVLASALNEDGYTPGISLPNSDAQAALIRAAYAKAGVNPADTGYIEAHGTGTQAGDPLEAKGILQTVGSNRTKDLYVGSVKTNIGHLEGAAGVAGVIKAALMVERGLIPRNLWFETLNHKIKLPDNVKIPLDTVKWSEEGPRRASVNSFGFGGANAHVILEDAASYMARKGLRGYHYTAGKPFANLAFAETERDGSANGPRGRPSTWRQVLRRSIQFINGKGSAIDGDRNGRTSAAPSTDGQRTSSDGAGEVPKPKVFVLSANDQEGIKRNVERLRAYVAEKAAAECAPTQPGFLDSLAHTLAAKRTVMPWKSFAVATDLAGLEKSLTDAPAAVRSSPTSAPRVAFVFTGQGAQWWAMGRGLVIFDAYRASMERSQAVLASVGCPWNLAEELGRSEADCNLRLAEYSQPTCTALQVALVDLLRSWGVEPAAVVGHSSGEIAAAYAAGMIDHEAAVKISWLRGQVSATVSKNGGMLAVSAAPEAVSQRFARLTKGRVIIACMNSPHACTVSGDKAAVDELYDQLKSDGTVCTKLPMDVAYHSFHMESARAQYEEALVGIPHRFPENGIPMFSSVTGNLVTTGDMKPTYWVDNLVCPVNFTAAVRALLHHTHDGEAPSRDRSAFASVFVELGPHSALRTYLLDIFKEEDRFVDLAYVGVLRRKFDGVETALQAAGTLWTKGCVVDLARVNERPDNTPPLVDLPPYVFNHSRAYWEESHMVRGHRFRAKPRTDLLGYRVPGAPDPTWRNFLRCSENPWIREHRVQGDILYPGAGIVIMAIEAAKELADVNEKIYGYELRDVAIATALLRARHGEGRRGRRRGASGPPTLADLISLTLCAGRSSSSTRPGSRPSSMPRTCAKSLRATLFTTPSTASACYYGPTFRNLRNLYSGGTGSSFGVVEIPDTKKTMPKEFEFPMVIHPATLDSVFHLLFPCISGTEGTMREAVVPFSFDSIFVSAKMPTTPGTVLQGHCSAKQTGYTTWTSSISVFGERDEPLIVLKGMGLASLGAVSDSADAEASVSVKEIVYERSRKVNTDSMVQNREEFDQLFDKIEYVCLEHIYKCLAWFAGEGRDFVPQTGFWKLYAEWMHDVVAAFPPLESDRAEVEAELQRCRAAISRSAGGEIREVEPLQVMTEGDLLYTFYRDAFGSSFNYNVAEYVGLIADKAPGLQILEVGAGTGGTTFYILNRLRNPDGTSRAARYYFTDISPGFLSRAAETFAKDASTLSFGTCNIENDPLTRPRATRSPSVSSGLLDTFRWIEDEEYHAPLPAKWVEIQTKAIGLNFHDVLVAMGNLAEHQLGIEAAGVVTRVGPDVTRLKPGDRVMCFSGDTFATYIRFPEEAGIPIPNGMDFVQAASMPVIYFTVYYAFVTSARLVKGESVLIHAAAGGVGQAAIQLAQSIGAEVFATVGSEQKKQLLMDQYGIPADHIFNSRDTSFYRGVMRATGGKGVDVVLNSLAGEALRLSWHCLAEFGRFCEIGKTDLLANTGLDMMPFLDNKSYFGINLLVFEDNPTPRAVALWDETARLIHSGKIRPVSPIQTFSTAETEMAFRAASGANNRDFAAALEAEHGSRTHAFDCDVSDASALQLVLETLRQKGVPPVRGCIVGAMVLQDTLFDSMTAADVRATVGPKVWGSWNLHQQLPRDMDFFFCLGSMSGVVGNRGQGNYACGNVFQDQLAAHRRSQGLPALTVDISYLLSVGLVAQHAHWAENFRAVGLSVMQNSDLHGLLATALEGGGGRDAGLPEQVVCGLPYNAYEEAWYWMEDARFAALRNRAAGGSTGSTATISLREELARCAGMATAEAEAEAVDLITAALVQRLAKLMMIPEADVDAGRPLSAYGVDSLVAVEVRNWIAREVAVDVSVASIMANVPMRHLAADLARKSSLLTAAAAAGGVKVKCYPQWMQTRPWTTTSILY